MRSVYFRKWGRKGSRHFLIALGIFVLLCPLAYAEDSEIPTIPVKVENSSVALPSDSPAPAGEQKVVPATKNSTEDTAYFPIGQVGQPPASALTSENSAPENLIQTGTQIPGNTISPKLSGAAEVIAYVDKSTITIGEKVKYTVEVVTEKDAEISFPAYTAQMGGFAVKDFGQEEPKKAGSNLVKRLSWYLLDTYTVGPYVIPPQPVVVKMSDGTFATLKSPEIFVDVKSLMDKEGKDGQSKEGLRDIKSPLSLASKISPLMIGATLLLILGLAGGLGWYLFIKRKQKVSSEPIRLPHEIALEELNRIEQMDLIAKRQIKEYYYLISNCLRVYLENRFGLHAPEQTTEEFLESVSRGSALEGKLINLLKVYLNHCDLVKYAKLEPSAEEINKALETTRQFIDETKPAPVVAVTEESEYDEEEISA